MANMQSQKKKELEKNEGPNLKGTFISVMLLGLFIIISWFSVYIIFMMR